MAATPPPKSMPATCFVIQTRLLDRGAYFGPYNEAFMKDLGAFMAKWKVLHIEAVAVPNIVPGLVVKVGGQSGGQGGPGSDIDSEDPDIGPEGPKK